MIRLMEELLINLLKILCPYLQRMAKKTASPVDDLVVRIICGAVEETDRSRENGGTNK